MVLGVLVGTGGICGTEGNSGTRGSGVLVIMGVLVVLLVLVVTGGTCWYYWVEGTLYTRGFRGTFRGTTH